MGVVSLSFCDWIVGLWKSGVCDRDLVALSLPSCEEVLVVLRESSAGWVSGSVFMEAKRDHGRIGIGFAMAFGIAQLKPWLQRNVTKENDLYLLDIRKIPINK